MRAVEDGRPRFNACLDARLLPHAQERPKPKRARRFDARVSFCRFYGTANRAERHGGKNRRGEIRGAIGWGAHRNAYRCIQCAV